ncbi:MAG: nuclear transport factor 2 family protein [Planctomycetota bacterium]|jgi:ketosteroid isomerase-like protein
MDEARIRDFFAAVSRGDRDALEAGLAEDVVLEFPGRRFGGRFAGRRKVLVFLRQNQRLFRDGLGFTVHWAGSFGDRTVAQWTNRGVTRDGADYENRGVTVFTVRDGLVAEIHDYLDTELIAKAWPE